MNGAPGFRRFTALDEETRRLLQSRARALAGQQAEENDGEQVEVLLLQAAGQTVALPLEAVLGVTELTNLAPVPRAPPLVRGLVSFRGEILVGVEAGAVLGSGQTGIADLRRVVALESDAGRMALLAEKVTAARTMDRRRFAPAADGTRPWFAGVDPEFVTLFDVPELIRSVWRMLGGDE